MKIIYKKTILEKIDEAIAEAVKNGKVIEKIYLHGADFNWLYLLAKGGKIRSESIIYFEYSGIVIVKDEEQEPHQEKFESVEYIYTQVLREEPAEKQPVPKLIPGAWVCDAKRCSFFIDSISNRKFCDYKRKMGIKLESQFSNNDFYIAQCCKDKELKKEVDFEKPVCVIHQKDLKTCSSTCPYLGIDPMDELAASCKFYNNAPLYLTTKEPPAYSAWFVSICVNQEL